MGYLQLNVGQTVRVVSEDYDGRWKGWCYGERCEVDCDGAAVSIQNGFFPKTNLEPERVVLLNRQLKTVIKRYLPADDLSILLEPGDMVRVFHRYGDWYSGERC